MNNIKRIFTVSNIWCLQKVAIYGKTNLYSCSISCSFKEFTIIDKEVPRDLLKDLM